MPGSINTFKSSFKTDVARPARFDVEIPIPLKLLAYRNSAQRLTMRCEVAELPSKTFETLDRKIYGPVEKQPYLTSFTDIDLTFIVSDDMAEKKIFDAWMELISPKTTFNQTYKTDYAIPITINQYDVQNRLSYSITLIDAFPISVNQLTLDWSNESSHHKLAVRFAFHTWENNSIEGFVSDFVNAGISAGVDAATAEIGNYAAKSTANPFDFTTGSSVYDMKSISGGFINK